MDMSSPAKSKTNSTCVKVRNVEIGPGLPLVLIAGPCVIESRKHTLHMASEIKKIASDLGIPLIFKASYDKANRTSLTSFRGPGLQAGLKILLEVREKTALPIVSDIHEPSEAAPAGEVLDLLQIPAFMCRQTDLLVAAARTNKPVNIKKGQFMAPEQMRNVVEKARASGSGGVLLTERGTFFGYGRLVNDMTAIPHMATIAPVVFDATHSCQFPGAEGQRTGGQREMAPILAQAAIAAGAHALFLEVHDDPEHAKSDATTVWPLNRLEDLLYSCQKVFAAVNP